jgi:hypothetical protein
MTGMGVDIWANRSVARAFDHLGLDYPKTEKNTGAKFYI